jgi:ABC-type transporter Mla maintaining outer membrane lipid asymmetry ATPase subunit MlaF
MASGPELRRCLTKSGSVFTTRGIVMPSREPFVQLRNVSKDYRGLRPLRIESLDVRPGQVVALVGFDQMMAEVLVDLITAAIVPETGEVIVFGQRTREIADRDAWLTTLDRFGLLTERAVLLDQLTVEQNLALPFSIALDDLSSDVRERVARLASEIGLEQYLTQQAVALSPALRLRVRLGRALALDPHVLLAEHPNAALTESERTIFAADLSRIVRARDAACVVLTADRAFARAATDDVLVLQPATGALKPSSGWRRWFA